MNTRDISFTETLLVKDLPCCPKLTIFKITLDGQFFYNITNETSQSEKQYIFSREEILTNPDFFIPFGKTYIVSSTIMDTLFNHTL